MLINTIYQATLNQQEYFLKTFAVVPNAVRNLIFNFTFLILHLITIKKEFKAFFNQVAPEIAGNVTVKLFKENFQNEGFFEKKWKEVQRRQNATHTQTNFEGFVKLIQNSTLNIIPL